MPALPNPRHELFAQAIVAGLAGETRIERAQSTAYLAAYPNCSEGNSAEAAASRLLRRVKPILERVKELQQEQLARLQPKLDLSKERVGRRLDLASQMAESEKNAASIVSAELGIAKVFGHINDDTDQPRADYSQCKSIHEIGVKLLEQVGLSAPSNGDVQEAIEAHDVLIERLQAIAQRAQALTLEQQT